jgi:hypothetical protein
VTPVDTFGSLVTGGDGSVSPGGYDEDAGSILSQMRNPNLCPDCASIFNGASNFVSLSTAAIGGAWTVGIGGAFVGPVLLEAGLSAPAGEAAFWTGGPEAQVAAQELGTTILDTPIGRAFSLIEDFLPESWQTSGWNYLSEQFASSATGDINVVVGPSSWGGSTFWQVEFPELVNSSYAGQVTGWAWTLVP